MALGPDTAWVVEDGDVIGLPEVWHKQGEEQRQMLRKLSKWLANRWGIQVRRLRRDRQDSLGFTLYRYLKADGSFDIERYRQVQTAGNVKKLDWVWVIEENVAFLADYIKRTIGQPRFGICHGARQGKEQEWFGWYLGCDVLGIEISTTATQFPNTIQWDFHDVKPEWLDSVDFIYSNAFDHSYDPEKCLNAWMSCLRKGGLCILEHSSEHGPEGASELDPFGADIVQMVYLVLLWGKGRYCVREMLSAPRKHDSVADLRFLVIQRL